MKNLATLLTAGLLCFGVFACADDEEDNSDGVYQPGDGGNDGDAGTADDGGTGDGDDGGTGGDGGGDDGGDDGEDGGNPTGDDGGNPTGDDGGNPTGDDGGNPTGDGGGNPTGDGGGGGECDTGDCTACQQCAQQGPCSGEAQACVGNQDCVDLANCLNGCAGDTTCQQQCAQTHQAGVQAYNALAMCVVCDACYTSCDGASQGC